MFKINLNRHQKKVAALGIWFTEENVTKALKIFQSNSPENCPAERTMRQWFNEFKNGKFMFEDLPKSGRPITVTNEKNIKRIQIHLKRDRKVTIKNLSAKTRIKKSSIRIIIARKLKALKLRPLMNPHKLTDEMKRERLEWCLKMQKMYPTLESMEEIVTGDETYLFFEQEKLGKEWTFPHEDTPRATKMMRYTQKKRMFYLFFNQKGIVHVAYRPLNQAANAEDYVLQLGIVKEKLGKYGIEIVIHDDNSRVHTAKLTYDYYMKTGMSRMSHPRYSPDLAPNDFWLIRKLKSALCTKKYSNVDFLYENSLKILKKIPSREYKRCFEEWRKRWGKCIERNGDYVEWKPRVIKRKI